MEELFNNTILIVDDTPENIDILVDLLEGFEKQIAINGADALETAWENNPPDLILLDIMMPEMDGYEVCKRLRENSKTKEVPVIFLTAKTEKDDIIKGFEAGGQDYVTKPFDARELIERVKTQLELKTQREILKNMNVVLEEKVQERTMQLSESNKRLEAANNKLLVLDDSKNNFLKLISHEIRTPLNGILGSTSFLSEMIEDPELKEFVEMLKESAERLDGFSKKALEITQMQTLGEDIEMKDISINDIIHRAVDASKEIANQKNIGFSLSLIKEDSLLGIDDYITGAVAELVNNAVKSSNENTTVDIITIINGNNFLIKISNTGETIPEDKIEEIVKPFGLANEHYDKHTGLGLSYVKSVLDLHHGSMEIVSTEEKTTVALIFQKSVN